LGIEDSQGQILNGQKLIINASGLEGGLRKKSDGVTFFGLKMYKNQDTNSISNSNISSNPIINDVILNYKGNTIEKDHLFYIFFKRNQQKYYIRNSDEEKKNDKTLIYLKITDLFEVKTKKFFFMGESLFYLEPYTIEK
jgi:hypothetical protein